MGREIRRQALLAFATALVAASSSACASKEAEPDPACFIDYEPEPEPASLHPEPTGCDPRAAPTPSPRIQPPVLVGEHPNGTVYVLDRIDEGYHWVDRPAGQDHSPRLFVSSERKLIEQEGGGGGGSAFTYAWGAFGSSDGSVRGSYRLTRDRDRRHVDPADAKMALRESEPELSAEELREQGLSHEEVTMHLFEEMTALRVQAECAVEAFEPVFLPHRPRRIAYVAQDERGHHILVTEPARHFDGYGFKVFYGPADRVMEYPTAQPVARERDGGTTTIRFTIDGEPAEFYFPSDRFDGGERQPTVTLPEQVLDVTRLSDVAPSQELPVGNTYICHDQTY